MVATLKSQADLKILKVCPLSNSNTQPMRTGYTKEPIDPIHKMYIDQKEIKNGWNFSKFSKLIVVILKKQPLYPGSPRANEVKDSLLPRDIVWSLVFGCSGLVFCLQLVHHGIDSRKCRVSISTNRWWFQPT